MVDTEKNKRIDKLLTILLNEQEKKHAAPETRLFVLETFLEMFKKDPSVVASRMALKMGPTKDGI